MVANQKTPRQEIIDQIKTLLGDKLIEVDAELENYTTALDIALDRYRQRSSNAVQEAVFFLTLRPEMQTYTLPKEIQEVTRIHRRGLSANAGNTTGNQYDPFSLAYTNLYLLQPTGQGDLLTYEYYNQWLETAGRMFGSEYDFRWDSREHKLIIFRHQQVHEDVLLTAYMSVNEDGLLLGTYSRPWIRSYALAMVKMIIGQAYEKFSSIPGPQGAITLNGSQLKAEGQAEMTTLEEEINKYRDGGRPLPFMIG
jgi:hypothetical protein